MATTTAAQMLAIPEVARRLGISRTSVYDLIKTQKLAVHNVGTGVKQTRMRVAEPDLAAFINATRAATLTPGRRAA